MKYEPLHVYQKEVIDKEVRSNNGCCLFHTMGAGKTRTIIELMKKFKSQRVLVISLSNVIHNAWPEGLSDWMEPNTYEYINLANISSTKIIEFFKKPVPPMTIVGMCYSTFSSNSVLHTRPKSINLAESEVLNLVEDVPWDMIVLDESTRIKDPTSKAALSMLNLAFNVPGAYVISATGTPNPETTIDLYTQVSVVDRGERFGQSFQVWQNTYFMKEPYGYRYIPQVFSQDKLVELISDISYILTKQELEKDLPPLVHVEQEFTLSAKELDAYKQMKEYVINLPDKDITAKNAGILTGKLAQLSSGFAYDNDGVATIFGNSKIIDTINLLKTIPGKVILVYYFTASLEMIETYLMLHDILYAKSNDLTDEEFRTSTHKVLLIQPKSGAYGSNHQYSGNVFIMYEIDFSGERFEQLLKRLHRPGQTEIVWAYYMVGKGTYDLRMINKVKAKDENAVQFLLEIKELQSQ